MEFKKSLFKNIFRRSHSTMCFSNCINLIYLKWIDLYSTVIVCEFDTFLEKFLRMTSLQKFILNSNHKFKLESGKKRNKIKNYNFKRFFL